ncbi:MAG: hypothetical protein KUG83_00740 [Gammaproteobacteria bacterium]|nr:hypothetical protein [Gammaproteobacteria bacterium]
MTDKEKSINNIAILTMDCLYSTIYLNALMTTLSGRVKVIMVSDRIGEKYGSAPKQGLDHFRQSGFKFILYLLAVHGLHKPLFLIGNIVRRILNRPRIFLLSALAKHHNIEFMVVKDINSKQVKEKLTEINPDLIISAYFDQILDKDVFEAATYGTINFHPGYLPDNPGPAPTFWAIAENRPVGSTIHFIDSGIDTGDIIVKQQVAHNASNSHIGLEYAIFATAHELTIQAIEMVQTNTAVPLSREGERVYHSYPDANAFIKLEQAGKCYFNLRDYAAFFTYVLPHAPNPTPPIHLKSDQAA